MKSDLFRVLTLLCMAIGMQLSLAGEFPAEKPITVVVPFSAGGPTDRVVRELALVMGRSLGQTVVVENVVGAGGTIGSRKVAGAARDGYTLLVHTMGMATAPSLYKTLGFDVLRDFDFVGQIVDVPMVILGSNRMAAKDFGALLTYIRSNPGKVSIGHAGAGSAAHLCTLLFEREVNAKLISVPYKGSAPALSDLIGGQIDLVCDQTTSTSETIKAGLVRPFAITSLQRSQSFERLQTANEQGLPGFDVRTWHGMYAPRGLPADVRKKLVAALQYSIRDSSFRTKMTDLGGQVVAPSDATPESLKAKLSEEIKRWSVVIRKSGIEPN